MDANMTTFLSRQTAAAVFGAAAISCLAANAPAATDVGTAAAVNTEAFGTPPGAVRQVKLIGDNVVYNERIETSGSGLVQVLLNDGSTFTVGANSNLVIDEFVYDPNAGTGKLVASFGKGVVRFVGGKVSKKKGGVAVKTPVGTIGIRGGIANLNLSGGNPVFSLLFGEDLTFNGNDGTRQRIYQSGYSLQVGPNGLGGQVRRTTPADLNAVQRGLAASPGQNGGNPNPPTGRQIARSGVPGVNSSLGHIRTTPVPKPRAVQATGLEQIEPNLLEVQTTTRQRTIDGIDRELPDDTGGDTGGEPPVIEMVEARILTAGDTFSPVWDSSRVVLSPGAQGLIGASYGIDENVAFSVGSVTSGNATGLYKAAVEGNKIYQFGFDGDGQYFYAQTYTDQDQVAQLGEPDFIPVAPAVDPEIEGNVSSYAWGVQFYNENFAAFAHLPNVTPAGAAPFDIEKMVFGLYGVGTDFTHFGGGTGTSLVRSYDLAADPTLMFSLGTAGAGRTFTPLMSSALFVNPLVAAELGNSFMSAVGSTGLKLIEDSASTLDGAHFLASSFHVDGSGSDQKSLISLAVGEVYQQDGAGTLGMSSGRRGGHRLTGSQGAALYTGPTGTVAGPDGGHFFGSDAQSFVFGNAMSGAALDDPYNDNYIRLPDVFQNSDTVSASLHVGHLSGTEEIGSLSRTDRTLRGYAAGVLESTANYGGQGTGPVAFSSSSASDLYLTFDSSNHSLGGSLIVRDVRDADPEVDSYTVRFGFNNDRSGAERATFIDDDTYAARDASHRAETYLTIDSAENTGGGGSPGIITGPYDPYAGMSASARIVSHLTSGAAQILQQNPNESPATYFIPNTLVGTGDDAIMAGVSECTCAFLEWGYWGTKTSYDDANGVLSSADRQDAFHLGTWIAGDVTSSASLPVSGSASYTGHAAGNVINNGAQYLAAGDFQMTVDFARRTGSANIANFDGRVFGADLTENMVATGNQFSGPLAGGVIAGKIDTSIVAGPNSNYQGVIGNFNATQGSWTATGIVAGEMQ